VTFVDPQDGSGFIGVGGEANVASSASDAGSPISVSATLTGFRARLSAAASGSVVFTLFVNGSATSVTCTIPSGQTTCSDTTHTVGLVPGNAVAVSITNSSGLLRHVRWSAELS
jgi:hypothetical protein